MENIKTIVIENPSPELQRFIRKWRVNQWKTIKKMKEKYKDKI